MITFKWVCENEPQIRVIGFKLNDVHVKIKFDSSSKVKGKCLKCTKILICEGTAQYKQIGCD